MTCIAGLIDDGQIYMGGDSAGVDARSLGLVVRADQKVFTKRDMVFGFTSSFRMGQLIRYKLELPEQTRSQTDDYEFLVVSFIEALRKCLKDGGYARKHDEVESAGTFLVGYRGRLYYVDNDYQVGIPSDGFAAVGCGEDLACGALYASQGVVSDPEQRIRLALGAAERFSAGVRGPFHVEVLAGAER